MKFCLILVLLCLPVAAASDEPWTRVASKNFVLIGNLEEKEIRRTGARLEEFRAAFQEIFPNRRFNEAPINVFIFKNAANFKNFRPTGADGKIDESTSVFFQGGEGASYIAPSNEVNPKQALQPIFHDYVHFLLDQNFGRAVVPPWVGEGLAEYYQTLLVENDEQIRLGAPPAEVLPVLREQTLISLERLFAFDHYTLGNQGNHGKSIFYAESWALIHYLHEANGGARRQQLKTFLNLLLDGKSSGAAFVEAFQTDLPTIERELRDYVAERSFTSRTVFKNKNNAASAEMQSAPLSESAALIYQADLLGALNRFDEAANLLGQSIKLDAKNAVAYALLGTTLARQNKFDRAHPFFEKAIALNPKNHLALYNYADSLRREATADENFPRPFSDERTNRMRQLLLRAIESNPNFAPSYRLLAFVNFANNVELNESVTHLNRALTLEPGNEQYQLDLGRVYLRQEKFDEARRFARRVFVSAEAAAVRADAQILLNNINSLEEQLRSIRERNARGDSRNETIIKYSEEELINQSINEALRKPRTGEKRLVGYLSNVVCGDSGISFIVRPTDQLTNNLLKLRANDFLSVAFMAFTAEASGKPIDCGARRPEDFIVVTYRLAKEVKTNFDGEVTAIEFVPKTLVLLP